MGNKENINKCGCGRSPTGECIGWHSLTEDMYQHKKMLWLEDQLRKDAEIEDYKKQAQELWSDSCTTGRSK
jgi:hypothetical protein